MGKIEELEEYAESLNPVDTWGWSVKRDRVWADKSSLLYFVGEIKQQLKSSLPTQQDKVVVPELIHKWIKHVKGLKWGLADLLNPSVSNSYLARDAKEWLEKDKIHAEILARAWLEDDYTVEKEPLYYVLLPFNEGNHIRTYYLRKGKVSGDTWFGSSNAEYSGNTARLTEQEIKDHDERYWAFAVPVEEDE